MTDCIYPRPTDVDLDTLLDALYGAGADGAIVGTGNPETIAISIDGASTQEIDTIWSRAPGRLGIRTTAGPGDPRAKA